MWKDLHLRRIYTNWNKVLEKSKSKEKSPWKERYHLYEWFNKRVALSVGNCVLRTNSLAVTQANHCSEFRILNCPITDDQKATFIELRIYSRELMVMFTLYYIFNLHRPEIYIPARLGLLFTLTEWWFRRDFCYWSKPVSKVKSLISDTCYNQITFRVGSKNHLL